MHKLVGLCLFRGTAAVVSAAILSVFTCHEMFAGNLPAGQEQARTAGQVYIVKGGKPVGRILAAQDDDSQAAAILLQDFVHRITGATIPILSETGAKPAKGDIIFLGQDDSLSEDAFSICTEAGRVLIASGGGNGSQYAVTEILEQYFGVRYYAADALYYDSMKDLSLPEGLSVQQTPTFRYRQTQSYSLAIDPLYKTWFRLEQPSDVFAGNLWVHTFNSILPSSVYGESHPEWYSYINGQRRPGRASQWCLTNPEVFEAACVQIDSIFKANPGMNLISVSQNDGNNTYCQCPSCMEVIEREGAVSGLYIEFLNKLASRFLDKEFSTLAYLFTMDPPKHIKPLPNVNIMLCDIDCDREVPLTDNASGQAFMKALEGWSAISDNIFVWDYGINFDNMVAPFPNFHIVQPNIQIFRDHHVTMHFSQIAATLGTDFSEMRSYLASKLMWNADADVDSLMTTFLDGYYGAAGKYLYQYEKMLEGALLASGNRLWIYDSPVSHADGMLNASCRKQYNRLFDAAEEAVKDNPEFLHRVWKARLPLQYSELEIARAEGCKDPSAVAVALDLFEQRTAFLGIPTLNERNNSPADYCTLFRERYLPGDKVNKALGAKVEYIVQPTAERYCKVGEKGLTDGIYGGATFVESWVGWEGSDAEFILDLGSEQTISYIGGDFLHQLGAWIFFPKTFRCWTSADGEEYTLFGEVEIPEDEDPQVKFARIGCGNISPSGNAICSAATGPAVEARYVKIAVEGIKTCPSWHYGVGQPAWFFLDEIEIY